MTGISFYTVFIASMYSLTGDTSDIGLIGAATLLPALLVVVTSAKYTDLLSPRKTLTSLVLIRVMLFTGAAALPETVAGLLIVAALNSLIHQAVVSAKMTLDADLLSDETRRSYLSRKTMLANVAVIIGPPVGGVAATFAGLRFCLLAGAGLGLVIFWMLSLLEFPAKVGIVDKSIRPSMASAMRHLRRQPDVLAMIGTYCLVVVILEVEAPLTFPFVREIFAKGGDVAGMLLGLCGLGGMAGALATKKFPSMFTDSSMPWFIVFDGLIVLAFTQSTSLPLSAALFTLMGCMGAVTIVIVEGAVQQRIHSVHRPTVFSLMQFAGGSGGASLGIATAFTAAAVGSKSVLMVCAMAEIIAGLCCLTMWVVIKYRKREKVSG
jgi:MFS family permease